jgi:hypothetical protein
MVGSVSVVRDSKGSRDTVVAGQAVDNDLDLAGDAHELAGSYVQRVAKFFFSPCFVYPVRLFID